MRTAPARPAAVDASIRPRALLAPLPLLAGAAGALGVAAVLFGDGSSDGPLFWIGGFAIVVAAAAGVSAAVGTLVLPELTPLALACIGAFAGFVVWQGLSILWSIEPDRTWNYFNRGLAYLAFLLLGLLVGTMRRAPRYAAGGLAVATAAAIGVALATKVFPGLSGETERVARLNSPVGYWNVLALLTVFALPLALWIAAPRSRPHWLRALGVLYLYAALLALLLTFSRGGVGVAIVVVIAWLAISGPRLEAAGALAIALAPTFVVAGWTFSRPALTKDAQPHARGDAAPDHHPRPLRRRHRRGRAPQRLLRGVLHGDPGTPCRHARHGRRRLRPAARGHRLRRPGRRPGAQAALLVEGRLEPRRPAAR